MVSGLFGKASMLLPFVNFIWVFWGLNVICGGRLCVKLVMRVMMRLVCRQDGPTTPMALFGYVTAYQSSNAHIR